MDESICSHAKSYVIDSRQNEFGLRRRRECANCCHRWTTIEIAFDDFSTRSDPWMVYRKATIEKFLRQQLAEIKL